MPCPCRKFRAACARVNPHRREVFQVSRDAGRQPIKGYAGFHPLATRFYEHVVRHDEELNRMRRYIEEKPLRLALDEENPHRRV
jgi:hypothetical protein